MIIGNCLIEAELIEQGTLVVVLTSHHHPSPTQNVVRRRNHCSPKSSNHFCNKICHKQTLARSKQRLYSITSSARASKVGGTVRPSALAVLRLITSSYLVGACTGRSAAFSPLRIRST